MKRYLIADLHFGHTNVIEYEQRPFNSVQEMDEALIKLWNSIVKSDDLVYVLGDFTLSRRMETIKYLVSQGAKVTDEALIWAVKQQNNLEIEDKKREEYMKSLYSKDLKEYKEEYILLLEKILELSKNSMK